MKKILAMVLYAGVMFGVTAGLGMFMLKKTQPHVETAEGKDADGEDTHSGEQAAGDHGAAPAADAHGEAPAAYGDRGGHQTAKLPGSITDGDSHTGGSRGTHHDERLPVAVRATPMSVEEIVRMGLSLKSRDEVVRKREATLREIEAQQRLALSDIASAQQDIENLLAQTSDQRAAKEELLSRITAQNQTLEREREALAAERELIKKQRDEFETARKQFDAEKSSVVQSESDLTIRSNELDKQRKLFEEERTRITLDGEKLVKEREKWLAEKEKIAEEKKQIALDRDKLRVDRELFEQDKRVLATTTTPSTSPTTSAQPTTPTTPAAPQDEASRQKSLKSVAQMLEGMSSENAASNIRELAATGNTEMVVDVLMLLEQRKSGAIMDALQDEKLASEFLLKMSNRNSAAKSAKKR